MTSTTPIQLRGSLRSGRSAPWAEIADHLIARYLARRAQRHLREERPQLAIFSFDHIGHIINARGTYEREELLLLERWLQDNRLVRGCAIDIGANIGNHSLFLSGLFEQVYAFEPNPRTFALLQVNSRLRRNIQPFALGLSDRASVAQLHEDRTNVGHSSLSQAPPDGGSAALQVPLRRLDDLEAIRGADVGLIKIDVEGHELQALMGARATIERNAPVILFEQLAGEIRAGTSPVIDLLRDFGYRRFAVIRRTPQAPDGLPALIRRPLNLALRLSLGSNWELLEVSRFEPVSHSLILACPERR